MPIAVDDVFRVVVEHQLGPEHALNVIHYQVSDVINSDEKVFIPAMIASMMTDWQATLALFAGEDTVVVCVTAQRIPPGEPTRIYTEFGSGVASARTAANGAQQCILFSKYSDAGQDPAKGRFYYPFPADEVSQRGQIDDTQEIGLLSQFGKLLLDSRVLATVGTVVVAIAREGLLPAVSLVTELVLRPVIATQQRRVKHHQNFIDLVP